MALIHYKKMYTSVESSDTIPLQQTEPCKHLPSGSFLWIPPWVRRLLPVGCSRELRQRKETLWGWGPRAGSDDSGHKEVSAGEPELCKLKKTSNLIFAVCSFTSEAFSSGLTVYGFTLLSYVLASREHDTSCILIKSEIDKPHLQTCHIRIDCPIKKNGFTHIVTGRGFNCTSLPSRRINTLDTLQRNWFLCLSERVVNYPLSWRHKKRLQREIRSRLDLQYGRFFTDISNEWLIISTDLSNSWVWRHINCNSFAQQTAMKYDSFHQTFGTIALH